MVGQKRFSFGKLFRIVALALVTVLNLYPLLWLIFGSLKSKSEFYANVWGPAMDPQWQNYTQAWVKAKIPLSYLNSLIVTVGALLIALPIICCAAYAIARLQFKLKKVIYYYVLIGLCIPLGTLMIALFMVALELGLVDTRLSLILFSAGSCISFGVFLMRGFFITIPPSLEEAALIDGCSRFQSFVRVILPLTKPGFMTIIVYDGMNIWNDYLMPSVLLQSSDLFTIPMGLKGFVGRNMSNFPQLFASMTMAAIPVIVAYIFAQKTFIDGMTAGAVKG